jgi:outer membrane protein assembly factor BamB
MSQTVPETAKAGEYDLLPPNFPRRIPRVWPGVLIVALMWLVMKVPVWFELNPFAKFLSMFWGPIIAGTTFAACWLFASRIRWSDRVLVLFTFLAAGGLSILFIHKSMTAFGPIMFGLPVALTTWAVCLAVTPWMSWPLRRATLILVILSSWAYLDLLRFDGVGGSMTTEVTYRWTPTAEQRFMAERGGNKVEATPAVAPAISTHPGDWTGFRGPLRDGRAVGVRIRTDWKEHPPAELWRKRVGPGWSSFAVVDGYLYTQEQRGEDEAVVCYRAADGQEVWSHDDHERFEESVAGPGPRSTPTFHDGKLFTLGAAGRLNCLDAATGKAIWSAKIKDDSGAKLPMWGFSASPLVAKGVVSVFAGGPDGKSVLGYDEATGKLLWSAGDGANSYSSTHLANLYGVDQIIINTDLGTTAFDPATGKVLWTHEWKIAGMARVTQPTILNSTDLLIGSPANNGTRRLHIGDEGGVFQAAEVWTTTKLSPYYNDVVVHEGYLYGFDGLYFRCLSLDDQQVRWSARGYANGQVLLLPEQGLLVIVSETPGDVTLVEATAAGHKPLGRFNAFKGKTWNHPVVVDGKLFVRNGEEMACYDVAEKKAE